MATKVFPIQAGTPVYFRPSGLNYSACIMPTGNGTGTAGLSYSVDNGFSYLNATPGAIATPYSFGNYNVSNPTGLPVYRSNALQGLIIQAQAAGGNGILVASDFSLPQTFGAEKVTLCNFTGSAGAGYAFTQSTTNETTIFSFRFPPNFLPLNFSLEAELWFALTNNVNVKTLKGYFGPVAYVPATGLEGGTNFTSQAMTSFSNFCVRTGVIGMNDGQTVLGQNLGSAAGWGGNATASVTISNTNYNAPPNLGVEQVLSFTVTKATGTDSVTLNKVKLELHI